MKPIYHALIALIIALSLDGMTKTWVEQVLVPFQPVPLAGQFFRLTLGYNTGVAFGLFANGGVWPLVVTGIIIVGMVIWLVSTLRSGELPPTTAWPMAGRLPILQIGYQIAASPISSMLASGQLVFRHSTWRIRLSCWA